MYIILIQHLIILFDLIDRAHWSSFGSRLSIYWNVDKRNIGKVRVNRACLIRIHFDIGFLVYVNFERKRCEMVQLRFYLQGLILWTDSRLIINQANKSIIINYWPIIFLMIKRPKPIPFLFKFFMLKVLKAWPSYNICSCLIPTPLSMTTSFSKS